MSFKLGRDEYSIYIHVNGIIHSLPNMQYCFVYFYDWSYLMSKHWVGMTKSNNRGRWYIFLQLFQIVTLMTLDPKHLDFKENTEIC